MAWQSFWTHQPTGDWIRNTEPLQSRLLRVRYLGDGLWLEKYDPRLYCRINVDGAGYSARWITLWPKDLETEFFQIEPLEFGDHFLEFRKRRNFESLAAQYQIRVDQYVAEPYLLSTPDVTTPDESVTGSGLSVGDDPITIDGADIIF